ncbi:MAG: tetratricopeptide repeat protein, partial [Vicinamibacteria bacterium]
TLEKNPLPLGRSLELAIEVAEGLARAHDKGIVHRDLKPSNVMLTEDGHAKIIDFGLAKLIAPLSGDASEEMETALRRETDPNVVMGTVSYMSPEQARGAKVDHRSDVFSFGILLHEMLTGRAPFRGASGIETLNAILKESAPRLPALGPEVSEVASFELQRIVDKCLAKDPKDRFQWMKDLVVDVRALWRRLQTDSMAPMAGSGAHRPVAAALGKQRWLFFGGVAAAIVLLIAALAVFFGRSPDVGAPTAQEKPSLAVLYFENNTGDPSLDWLRTALTDMLVTDLSQSPDIEVLSTDRLYQILEEMNRLDERITSFTVVQELAKRASVDTVLLGSFVKAGETIRISVRLQEASTGKILTTERVEGVGEDSIFPMVDDLTRRIKTKFELPTTADAEAGHDADLKDVTTSSVEAYRYYAEGIHLHNRYKEEEAIPLFEKAVEIDPDFAMALAKLSVVHGNVGHSKEARDYAERAIEHADRLSARERHYIEGLHYSRGPATLNRAVEAYEKAIGLYADHSSARHNVAGIYANSELFDKALPLYEELVRRRFNFAGTYGQLADIYAIRGDFEKGLEVLEGYLELYPDSAEGHRNLGAHFANWGRLDEALDAYDKAASLAPAGVGPKLGRRNVFVLREQWKEADAIHRELMASADPFRRWQGATGFARTELYRGRSGAALEFLEQGAGAYEQPGLNSAIAHLVTADVLIQIGEGARALVEAQKAQRAGKEFWPEWWALLGMARAQAVMGRWEDAEESAREFARLTESFPGETAKRDHRWLTGEMALIRGDTATALEELRQAASMLPARGLLGPPPPHVPIWFSLASAHLAAGNELEAAEWFRRIAGSTKEHLAFPIRYVRSFYFLGRIHENRGEMDKAREYYQRFLDLWRDGDMERERVIEALDKVA